MVVHKGNSLIVLLNAIDSDSRLAVPRADLKDGDVVEGFPVSVVQREPLPIHGEARSNVEFVYFEPQSEE